MLSTKAISVYYVTVMLKSLAQVSILTQYWTYIHVNI